MPWNTATYITTYIYICMYVQKMVRYTCIFPHQRHTTEASHVVIVAGIAACPGAVSKVIVSRFLHPFGNNLQV